LWLCRHQPHRLASAVSATGRHRMWNSCNQKLAAVACVEHAASRTSVVSAAKEIAAGTGECASAGGDSDYRKVTMRRFDWLRLVVLVSVIERLYVCALLQVGHRKRSARRRTGHRFLALVLVSPGTRVHAYQFPADTECIGSTHACCSAPMPRATTRNGLPVTSSMCSCLSTTSVLGA